MSNIKRKQAYCLDHMTERIKLKQRVQSGKSESGRNRGCQRIRTQERAAIWLGRSTAGMLVDIRDREDYIERNTMSDRHYFKEQIHGQLQNHCCPALMPSRCGYTDIVLKISWTAKVTKRKH